MPRSAILKSVPHSAIPYHIAIPTLSEQVFSLSTNDVTPDATRAAPVTDFTRSVQSVFDSCKREAHAIVETARRDADTILSSAKDECDRLFLDARKRGEQTALADATRAVLTATAQQRTQVIAAARAEVESKNAPYTELLKDMVAQRAAIIESAETELVRLAIGIAETILDAQPRLEPEYVVRLARKGLSRLAHSDNIQIRCAPQEHAVLIQHHAELEQSVGTCEVIADTSLSQGALIVESADGHRADASLQSQLARVRDSLLPATTTVTNEDLRLAS